MKIPSRMRQKINTQLHKECNEFRTYIPIGKFKLILEQYGIQMVNEDGTPYDAIFCGKEGSAYIELRMNGEKVENSVLSVYWYRFSSGNYDVNAYLS